MVARGGMLVRTQWMNLSEGNIGALQNPDNKNPAITQTGGTIDDDS